MYTYMSNYNYLCYMFLCYKGVLKNLKQIVTVLEADITALHQILVVI